MADIEERVGKMEGHLLVINHELGVLCGQMGIVVKLVVGTLLSSTAALLAVVGKICYDILIGG